MPRSGRGGSRSGIPGASYSNRSDLNTQPVRTGRSTSYGSAAAMADAQRAVPLPAQGGPPAPPPPGFSSPSAMPGEPVTAGMMHGPGAGPSASTDALDPITILRAVYARSPNEGLRRYLTEMGEL